MFSLSLDKYISSAEKMKREWGDKSFPVWLLVNPKHPAVRHNIWAPILAVIQDKVYREIHARIDTTDIYIRNAVSDCDCVPNTLNWWGAEVASEIDTFKGIAHEYQPKILITFGAFPYEFMRRVYEIRPEKGPKAWSNHILCEEFGKAMENFDINKTNKVPLLRRVISSGKHPEDDNYYQKDGENYFHYAGTKIAERIIEHKDTLDIWIR